MKKAILVSSIIGAMSAQPALAQDYADFEAYIGGARYIWDEDRNLDNADSIEAGIEIPLDEVIAFEAWLGSFDSEASSSGADIDGQRYSLGALYHFAEKDVRPFISAGLAHQELEPAVGDEDTETQVYLGLGAKKYFDNNFVLRGELLGMNSIDYEVTDVGIRLSLGYAFGKTASSKPVVAEPAPVEEKEEKPVVVAKVEKAPEPAPAPVVAPEPVKEAVVVDSDKDGVPDDMDKCPDTDSAFRVDESGCAKVLIETVNIDMDVKFKSNSAEISANESEIKELADFLRKFPGTSVTVEGYTDSRGSDAYNKQLSQKRADAVREALIVKHSIDPSRVNSVGYGEINPIASNDTPEGREANRRVVAKVTADLEKKELK